MLNICRLPIAERITSKEQAQPAHPAMPTKKKQKRTIPHIKIDWSIIREAAVAGVPVAELCKRYGCTQDAVYQRIHREGWATPHKVAKLQEERDKREEHTQSTQAAMPHSTASSCQPQAHTEQPQPPTEAQDQAQEAQTPQKGTHTQAQEGPEAQSQVARVEKGADSLDTMRQVEQRFGVSDGSGGGAILAEKGRIWDENSLIIAKAAEKTTSTLKDLPLPGVENLGDVLKLLTILQKSTGQDKPTPPVQVNLWSAGSGL